MTIKKPQLGFSIIELMVVLSIISILTGIVLPKLKKLKINTARVEVTQNFNMIYGLQQTYYSENGRYGGFQEYGFYEQDHQNISYCERTGGNALGFRVSDPCKLRYRYGSTTDSDLVNNYYGGFSHSFGQTPHLFTATATAFKNQKQTGGRGFGISDFSCMVPGSTIMTLSL